MKIEDFVSGSGQHPIIGKACEQRMNERREAVRVILLDREGRTLLFRGGDPDPYWFTPGGGLDEGEDLEAAARREVWEEVGLRFGDLGPPLASEEIEFVFDGRKICQGQTYFRVRLDDIHEVSTSGWTDLEVRCVSAHRWWTRAEIESTQERIFPVDLIRWL